MYFAQNCGQLFTFECIPANIRIIRENLTLNPLLAPKVTLVQKALWNQSGDELVFADAGPGSRPGARGPEIRVETQSLDDFVASNHIDRIDLIKMDIEGAEPQGLAGAIRTIRKHKPQLAVSIYYDPSHLASIPNWIDSLNLGYRFWLDHFTILHEETILFARADS